MAAGRDRAFRERRVFGCVLRTLLGGGSRFSPPPTDPRRRRTPAEISPRAGSQEGGYRGGTTGEDICRVFLSAAGHTGHLANGNLFRPLATECGNSRRIG